MRSREELDLLNETGNVKEIERILEGKENRGGVGE